MKPAPPTCYAPLAVVSGLSVDGPAGRVSVKPPKGAIGVIPVYSSMDELRKHFPTELVVTLSHTDIALEDGDSHGTH